MPCGRVKTAFVCLRPVNQWPYFCSSLPSAERTARPASFAPSDAPAAAPALRAPTAARHTQREKQEEMSAWRVVVLLVVVLGVCVCTWFRTTTPSSCRNTAPGVGLDFRSLPTEVKRFGKELFGSRNSFLRLLNRTQPPTAVKIADGRCMWLVQHPKDNSLLHLSREVPKDEYQLARLHFPISRGGLMVDVGAGLGDQSIAAHLWDPGLQVLAIEPVPLTFLFLLLNLHLNALQRGQIDRRLAVPARHLGPFGPTSRARGCSTLPGGVASLGTLEQAATPRCVSRPSRHSSSRLWVCLLSAIADRPASCHCTPPSRTKTITTVASDGARASHRMRRSISRDTAAPRRVAPARSGQRVRCRPYTCPLSCRA